MNFLFIEEKRKPIELFESCIIRAVVSGGAGGTLAPPEFRRTVNPIPTKGADYAHHITGSTPGFGNLTTALHFDKKFEL